YLSPPRYADPAPFLQASETGDKCQHSAAHRACAGLPRLRHGNGRAEWIAGKRAAKTPDWLLRKTTLTTMRTALFLRESQQPASSATALPKNPLSSTAPLFLAKVDMHLLSLKAEGLCPVTDQ